MYQRVVDRNENNTPPPESKESLGKAPVKATDSTSTASSSRASIEKPWEQMPKKNFKTTSPPESKEPVRQASVKATYSSSSASSSRASLEKNSASCSRASIEIITASNLRASIDKITASSSRASIEQPWEPKMPQKNFKTTPRPESKELVRQASVEATDSSSTASSSRASIEGPSEQVPKKNFKTTSVANGHYANIGQYINACFKSGKICDMCFRIGDLIWPVHRVVLASQSNLFRSIFESEDFSTKPWTPKQIALRGVEQETLSAFLQFLYSGDINIQASMIPDLLKLARVFEVEKLRILCHQQIPLMNNEDLLKLLKTMILVKDYELCDIIMRVVAERGFGQIRECDAFYDLDVQTLCMVLSYDGLIVKSEVEVFNAAVAWLHHHNIEERMKSLERVMDSIRFSLMSPKSLFKCYKKCPALKGNAYCNQLITMANWVQTSISLNEEDPLNIEFPTERNAVSGTSSVHQYMNTHCSSMPDPMDPVEFTISPLPQEIAKDFNDHACLQSGKRIAVPVIKTYSKSKASVVDKTASNYKEAMIWADPHWFIVGGAMAREGRSPLPSKSVMKYSNQQWVTMAPMNVARMKHALCVLDGLIYAIGGIGEGNQPLNTVECYNPKYDCWFFVKDLPDPRAGASASAEGGNIYLQGGYRGLRGKGKPCFFYPGEEVCRYNVHTNKWTTGY
nr:kelch-like protein 3 isoform X2 [Crassostrea virginica]